MEFPDLGQNCSQSDCNRLDFLPVKCDLCHNTYCVDHYPYANHLCPNSYKKDNQVPICPLCNQPVPIKRGELPDIRVGQHIDLDCESDPAIKKRNKIFKNKCSVKGCKQKELMPLMCNECSLNHCLKHRHPADHNCQPKALSTSRPAVMSMSGSAAMKRFEQIKTNVTQKVVQISNQMKPNYETGSRSHSNSNYNNAVKVQGNFSEDEALARALQQSMIEENHSSDSSAKEANHSSSNSTQYDQDLARAIAESQRNVERNKDKCLVS
ncbi:AN1-type zinc finger protein 2A-like [Oppia nitens]|uniref:AN1-type zinc finger protein 2A-like n=1 Tax=Oppia nitens TaxID=1686743 RepID=UPI0023DC9A01|nr:AN1-type zinc finger protein 2A-like [Oppia nitens]